MTELFPKWGLGFGTEHALRQLGELWSVGLGDRVEKVGVLKAVNPC